MERNLRLRYKILIPLLSCLVLIGITAISCLYINEKKQIERGFQSRVNAFQELFPDFISREAAALHSQIEVLMKGEGFRDSWLKQDRELLFKEAAPFFRELHDQFDVTHFYFIRPDRECFLRVHNPKRYGDFINRYTMEQAAAGNVEHAEGIELGPLGTFTLRVVHPWYKDDELIGYVELGKEIEHLTPALKKILDIDLVFAIEKTFLNRSRFEEGMKMLGRPADWDRYPQDVVVDSTFDKIPKPIQEFLSKKDSGALPNEFISNNRTLRSTSIALVDAGSRTVGQTIITVDMSNRLNVLYKMIGWLAAAIFAVGLALGALLYLYAARAEKILAEAFDELKTEVEERKKKEVQLKEHETQLNTLIKKYEDTNKALQTEVEERRKAEEELQLASKVLDNTGDGVIITSADKKIIKVNHAFGAITGYTVSEVMGKSPKMLSAGRQDDSFYSEMEASLDSSGRWEGQVWDKRKNGDVFPAWLSISSVKNHEGHLANYVAIYTDVTERVKAEEEKLKQEKFESILELAGAVCHELNQPLQAVMGNAQLLTMCKDVPVHKTAKIIQDESHRMGQITQKLMRIAKYKTKDYLDKKIIDLDKSSTTID